MNASSINSSQNLYVRNYIGIFVTNKYLRINHWNQKFDQILKLKYESVFQEKSKKDEIVENLKELVQLIKDKGIRLEVSLSNSLKYYKTTHMVAERSSENSTSNEGTSYVRGDQEEKTSSIGIFEKRT